MYMYSMYNNGAAYGFAYMQNHMQHYLKIIENEVSDFPNLQLD